MDMICTLSTFEHAPKEAETMKQPIKSVTPGEYKKLLDNLASLKKDLAKGRLRADFYEGIVAFGKGVYDIGGNMP